MEWSNIVLIVRMLITAVHSVFEVFGLYFMFQYNSQLNMIITIVQLYTVTYYSMAVSLFFFIDLLAETFISIY